MKLADFKRRTLAAAYLARRLAMRGEPQRFAPSAQPAFRPDAPAEQGVVDGVRHGVVRGWARLLDRPAAAVSVDVYLDDDYLGRADCGLERADLARMDGFDDGRCGFAFFLPERALSRGGQVRVFAAASGLELAGGPVQVEGWCVITASSGVMSPDVDDLRAPFGGATSLAQLAAAYGRRSAVLSERDPICADAGFPVTRIMTYWNLRHHGGLLPCRGSTAYCELLLKAADHFASAPAGLPVSAVQVEALAAPTGGLLGGRVRTTVLIDHVAAQGGRPSPGDEPAATQALLRFVMDVLVRHRLPLELLGESATRFLAEPVGGETRFLRAFGASPVLARAASQCGGPQELAEIARAAAERLGLGALAGVATRPSAAPAQTPPVAGVRIISGDYGASALSSNARQSARAFESLGVTVTHSQAPMLRLQQPAVFAELGAPVFDTLLLHVQPDDAVEVILRLPPEQAQARLIGFFVWETETLPALYTLGALLVDEIWTASDYCQEILSRAAPAAPVITVGHAVDAAVDAAVATPSDFDARAWAGVAPDDYLVLFHFDAHAWITRKNPTAVVRAFRQAFAQDEADVRLLIKIRGADEVAGHRQHDHWAEFAEEAARDLRIRVINDDLDSARMSALTAATDAYISLHRSEGFGYGVAEAMLAGKPVIVTDYSGTKDFTSPHEAMLVPATRRRVARGEFLHGDGEQVWSEPDVAAAAQALRTLYTDRALGARLGAAGRRRMLAQGSIQRLAERYAEHLRSPAPATRQARSSPQGVNANVY